MLLKRARVPRRLLNWLVLFMPTCPKACCDEGRVASNFQKRKMEEHLLRRAAITNDMHEQKQKEKGEES